MRSPLRCAALLSLWFLVSACATSGPAQVSAIAPVPRETASFFVRPPLEDVRAPAAAPLLDPVTPESQSLAIVRQALLDRAPKLDALDREGVARALVHAESEHALPALMLLAVIEQESRFDPRARSPRGALGLMQIRPFVASDVAMRHKMPWRGHETLYDPVANVRIGVTYLAELRADFGSTELALAGYNAGPTRVRRHLRRGRELIGPYVRRVMQKYHALRADYGDPETAIGG